MVATETVGGGVTFTQGGAATFTQTNGTNTVSGTDINLHSFNIFSGSSYALSGGMLQPAERPIRR